MHRLLGSTFTIGALALLAGCGSVSQIPIATPQDGTRFPTSSGSSVMEDAGRYSLLYAFRLEKGAYPYTLVYHKGDIFGETYVGGDPSCDCGVVFKLSPIGRHYEYTVLHVFTGGSSDGADPTSLIVTSSGSLYGTTGEGGGSGCRYSGYVGCGTIFKLTPTVSNYTYSILYRFKGGDDGYSPNLARDQHIAGTSPILGSASGGMGGSAFLFKLVWSGSEYTKHVLWNFDNKPGQDGVDAPIVVDGAMYGTAYANFGRYTYAYRFESGHFTVLLKFQSNRRDGRDQSLTASDAAGNLYGATYGGIDRCYIGNLRTGCGVVFELVASGGKYKERVLHRFRPGSDGWLPIVSEYDRGVLYGTTGFGGNACNGRSDGCGVVFALSTVTGKETVLYRFVGGVRGACECSNVVTSPSGKKLFGATSFGGRQGAGTAFQLLL